MSLQISSLSTGPEPVSGGRHGRGKEKGWGGAGERW